MALTPTHGRMLMYCEYCNHYFVTTKDTFSGECPACGKISLIRRCTRCGHKWKARTNLYIAQVCPKCKSPYWNRERTMT